MNESLEFNASRLKFARKRRGLTIKALSEKVGLTSKSLSSYENKSAVPSGKTIISLANALDFPKIFFYLDDIGPIDASAVSFRSLSRTSAAIRDAALHAGQIALELSRWIDAKFETPCPDIPDLVGHHPTTAAAAIRRHWGLGEKPINNLVHLLEAKGIRVFSLVEKTLDMDAYSFWIDDRPFVFLNTQKSVERGRFDAAHELGHLVLHKHGAPRGKEVETEAHQFASALLMPEGSILASGVKNPSYAWIFKEKKRWKVSAAALVRRLKELSLISEWQYRNFMVEFSGHGYLKNEPEPISEREASKLFSKVFNVLKDEGISKYTIAKELSVSPREIDSLIFNLSMTAINGGFIGTGNVNKPEKGKLKLVK